MTNVPVVSYARISADIRRDEHGVQDQHRLNRETAERHGWTVVHEYTDNDKSAAKADVVRDDFEAMLRALRAGELPNGTAVQGVVIVAEDRLARRPGDYERFVEAITYQDGRVFADARGAKDLYSQHGALRCGDLQDGGPQDATPHAPLASHARRARATSRRYAPIRLEG